MHQLTDQQILEGLRRKPYSRICREAATRLEALLAERKQRTAEKESTVTKEQGS